MRSPAFWYQPVGLPAIMLTPLAHIYGALEAVRRHTTVSQHADIPVICVGNLTAGGAGKTPTVRALAKLLHGAGFAPAVLSRGYGGNNTTTMRVDPTHHRAIDTGDEPLMLAQDLPVYVARDRRDALNCAIADGMQLAIKDDGFQNPTLAHNYNLIVVDAKLGLGNGLLLPAGPLRQPLTASAPRIDAVLVIGGSSNATRRIITDRLGIDPTRIFTGDLVPVAPVPTRVLAYCGIGQPAKFFDTLRDTGFALADTVAFADHHLFTDAEAAQLIETAKRLNAKLMTTEKDLTRLRGAPAGSPLAALSDASACLPVELVLDNAAGLIEDVLEKLNQPPH